MSTQPLQPLQNEWKLLYQKTLPDAARSKLASQSKWPVHNDHCFARIILDNMIGVSVPWTEVLKSPAYKNMSAEQLRECIKLGRQIIAGTVNLVELDGKSLEVRGKAQKGKGETNKGKEEDGGEVISKYFTKQALGKRSRTERTEGEEEDQEEEEEVPSKLEVSPISSKKAKLLPQSTPIPPKSASKYPAQEKQEKKEQDLTPYIRKIALSSKTPFQKRVLTLLCQVPRGQYTTYGAISTHLSSSPRAVGNAIRNNPFAPHVPCHRILATGGGIGGFHGSWGRKGEEGLNDNAKRELLRGEGVRFDGRGKVVGSVWKGFEGT